MPCHNLLRAIVSTHLHDTHIVRTPPAKMPPKVRAPKEETNLGPVARYAGIRSARAPPGAAALMPLMAAARASPRARAAP